MHMPSIGSSVKFIPTRIEYRPVWTGEVAGHGDVQIGGHEKESVLIVRVDAQFEPQCGPFRLVVVDASMLIQ